ncbi:hypothetical protein SAMN02745163_03089 [Clostridium cavendishii DSM 21758]|uniref:Glycosyltransferase 2-like domain-containing protein n=1 Tax=Clostridium cavendishii DSM 21758 TaxID=1121302 RepID=A0A1M6PAK4_9CLOT|nr:glycosyltransferase family 2 protein [Clostridium cavendishii]SHK05001.1 hypothetical protein SAMN02745163_03089 [Clostridium cavendishii DSM 21758]
MKANLFLSIIIPMYNTEDYVTKCLESLNKQKDKDFEILLIDDGSTDKSYLTAIRYLENTDLKYKITKQSNKGQSIARNVGITEASGEYILFLDSDDFVSENLISCLKNNIKKEKFDVVLFNYNRVNSDYKVMNNKKVNLDFSNISGMDILYAYKDNKFSLWTSSLVYSRGFLQENKMNYLENVYGAEDLNFIFKALILANKITYIDKELSYYYQRKNSLTNSPNILKNITVIDAFEDVVKFVGENNIDSEIIDIIEREFIPEHIMYQILGTLNKDTVSDVKGILNLKTVKGYLKRAKYETTRYGKIFFVWIKLAAYVPNIFIKQYLKKKS